MIIRIIWLSLACVASVRKEREGNLGERPRTREKGGEERVPLLLPRASFVLLTRPKSSFPSLWNACHSGWIISQTVGKNGMFVLVTLRFLSNLPITSIASLLYFFHVSVVRFNVWLNLSIKDNVLLNTVQILSIICVACRNNEKWTQYARTVSQYRSIQFSYLHTFLFECVYGERPIEFPGFLSLENRRRGEGGRGCHNHLGTLITPAELYGYTWSWIPMKW